MNLKPLILGFALVSAAMQAAPPQATISSSGIRAQLYLPDAQSGYYRGTRFDWSGVISSLEWNNDTFKINGKEIKPEDQEKYRKLNDQFFGAPKRSESKRKLE